MNFTECMKTEKSILMEGALGERLKREYHITFDEHVIMANLVYSEQGRKALRELWGEYAQTAYRNNLPFIATTPTRRTNSERVAASQYDENIILDNVAFLKSVAKEQEGTMYVGGLIGNKGDAYTGEGALSQEESESFHEWEIERFTQANVDFIFAALIPTLEEAAGIAIAMKRYKLPYLMSFTIQANGCLIDGTTISDAIQYIDDLTQFPPIYYMTNCVHPRIVYEALLQPFNNNKLVHTRFAGIQANTSALSYDMLDASKDLKTSDPNELATDMIKLRNICPFKIFGGCCGTDNRHMSEIARRL